MPLCAERVPDIRRAAHKTLLDTSQLRNPQTCPELIATQLGIYVDWLPLSDQCHGTSYDDGVDRLILVNSRRGIAVQRYALSHELGHLIRQHSRPRHAQHEEAADLFALELLLPACRIAWQLRDYDDDCAAVAFANGVRVATVKGRLAQLDRLAPGWRDDCGFADLLTLAS